MFGLRLIGDLIDCTRMGVGGKAIPPYIDKITDIRCVWYMYPKYMMLLLLLLSR